jgi:hypothetical protein
MPVPGEHPHVEAQDMASFGDTIYVALAGEGVYYSTDTGASWVFASAGLPANEAGSVLATNGVDLYWGLSDGNGVFHTTDNGVTWNDIPVGVPLEPLAEIPRTYALEQNFPNPFNPSSTIQYDLPGRTHVKLEVFNLLGERVLILVDQLRESGRHAVVFDAGDLASGVYVYRLSAGGSNVARKLVLLR